MQKVEKVEAKNETKNDSNASNSTAAAPAKNGTKAAPAAPPAAPKKEIDLVPEDGGLNKIRELKAKQDKEKGTDSIGTKQADAAKEITDSKKDMAAGEGNPFKDDANPSLVAKK